MSKRLLFIPLFFVLNLGAQSPDPSPSYYMDLVYPYAKKRSPDLDLALNAYKISLGDKKIAASHLGPNLSARAGAGFRNTRGDTHSELRFSDAGFILFQPIFNLGRYFDFVLSKHFVVKSELRKEMAASQFAVLFAQTMLKVSESKTRYYFSKQKLNFLKDYWTHFEGHLREDFEREHPGEVFNPRVMIPLISLRNEIEAQRRNVGSQLTVWQNEMNRFRTIVLGVKPYPFERQRNFPLDSDVPLPDQPEPNHRYFSPEQMTPYPLTKYVLVNPFLKREDLLNNVEDTLRRTETQNLNLKIAYVALSAARTDISKAKGSYWPEISLFANLGGDWKESNHDRKEYNRRDEGSIELRFSVPLFDGGERKNQRANAELRLNSVEDEIQKLRDGLGDDAATLHREVKTAIENIDSLLISYRETRDTLQHFLEDEPETGSDLDRRLVVEQHFSIAEELAIQQHVYLTSTLHLLALRNEVNGDLLRTIERRFFIPCSDFRAFLGLDEISLPR